MEMTIDDLVKIALHICDEFYMINNYDINIEFCENIYDKRLELAIDDYDRRQIIKNRRVISTLTGTIVLPEKINGKYYVLIKNSQIENLNFIGTIVHEITHISDFINLYNYNNASSFREVEESYEFDFFYYWTEYHAKYMGYKILRIFLFDYIQSELTPREEQLKLIREYEFETHKEKLLNILKEIDSLNMNVMIIYESVHFLSRINAWCDIFEELRISEFIEGSKLIELKKELNNIYDIFRNLNDFTKAIENIENIKNSIIDYNKKLCSSAIYFA